MTEQNLILILPDGSLTDSSGKLLFFSIERFRNEIAEGDRCFVCGANPNEKPFNDEHVIPKWLLRECGLSKAAITLPNGKAYPYARYKVPCCVECNTELGLRVEIPISELFKSGYANFVKSIRDDADGDFALHTRLFHWLNLLFLKTHLKDRSLPFSLDQRVGTEKISELYDWPSLHHIHCISRLHSTKPVIDHRVLGSMFILPALNVEGSDRFDYGDLHEAKTMLVRINDIAVIAVLDDSCGCWSSQPDFINKWIKGPLGPIQLREILARTAYVNTLIQQRPKFYSDIQHDDYCIGVQTPENVELNEPDENVFGAMMFSACKPLLNHMVCDDPVKLERNIKSGKWTFIVDSDGKFIEQRVAE